MVIILIHKVIILSHLNTTRPHSQTPYVLVPSKDEHYKEQVSTVESRVCTIVKSCTGAISSLEIFSNDVQLDREFVVRPRCEMLIPLEYPVTIAGNLLTIAILNSGGHCPWFIPLFAKECDTGRR